MSNQKRASSLVAHLVGRDNLLTIPRAFITITGDLNAALLLSQIIYWSDKGRLPGGWFAKSYPEWKEELSLSKAQIMRALKILKDWHVETKVAPSKFHGRSPTLHYRIDMQAFEQSMIAALKPADEDNSKESELLDSKESELSDSQLSGPSITETTAETTTTSSSPKNGDAPHQENSETSSDAMDTASEVKAERIPLEDDYRAEVDAFFQLTGMADGLRFKYYHFMAGSASNKKAGDWYKLQLQPGMPLEELRAFRKWYIATNKPAMSSPETIHANAARFRAERAKQAAAAERAAAQRERARVEEEAFTPMTEEERRAVEARYADEMRRLGRSVDMTGVAS